MCAQCVTTGAAYLVPAVAGLQVYKARVRKKRRVKEPKPAAAP